MGKLQGYNLLAFLLMYYATTGLSIDSDSYIRSKIPNMFSTMPFIPYVLMLAPFFSGDLELSLLIWTYVVSYKSTRAMVSQTNVKYQTFAPSSLIISLIVALYTQTLPQSQLALYYSMAGIILLMMISSGVVSTQDIIEDITLSHLIFYFVK